jgi:Domain of unknown function (DUF4411)
MSFQTRYLLDSDSFIRSKREHYAPDICPGFWASLLHPYSANQLASIRPVREELLKGKDHIAHWITNTAPDSFFIAVDDDVTVGAYKSVAGWIEANTHYKRPAKSSFMSGADAWLIASAIASKATIVTYEKRDPDNRARIKIPDVAHNFGIDCTPPYAMLRALKCLLQFDAAGCA